MAIQVKHKFVSAIPDAGDPTIVQPSNWNDTHDLTGFGTSATLDAGVANGVATLDGSGTVPISQLPAAVLGALSYQGTWNASTNTPTLTSSVGTKGYYYVVSVAGSTNLNGISDWQIGDWAVYNGSAWQKIDNTDVVTSVNGYVGAVVLGYGDITTGIVAVANGGTGVTTSSGANSVVLRDANQNITANAIDDNYTNTAASGTTITLTVASARRYTITGSGGQVIKLPDATTLTNGAVFAFDNNQSSGAITVNNNSNTLVVSVPSGGFVLVNLLSNATSAGSWDRHDQAPSNVSWSTNTFDYAGSITSATWNGATIAVNRGGTGATTLTGYVKGSGTTALTASSTIPTTDLSGTITNAQLQNSAITINGTSTSLGGSINVGTVTSVAATVPAFLSVTGSPITSSGTLGISYSGTALPAANGGTGLTTVGTAGNVLTSNGTTWVSQSPSTSSYTRTTQTATASQTTFSVTYTAPFITVYLNGVLLNSVDYTATNGTTVVLATGATSGDILDFIAFTTSAMVAAGGSNTQIQYNSGGALAGNANFTYTGNDVNIPYGSSNSASSISRVALAISMMS